MRTSFPGSAFNGSAIFDDDGLRDNGSVDQEVVCILEHEGIDGEFLSFFDRNGRIGMNMQICTHITAANRHVATPRPKDAVNGTGASVKRREDLYKMAESVNLLIEDEQ